VRTQALQIIAMRINGHEDEEIAKLMGISKNSISPYVYRATRNGWLDIDYDPKQRVQYQMMHNVVRNLEEGLNDEYRNEKTGMKVKTTVALKVAEGTLFKQFDQQVAETPHTTIVAVKVIMPEGPLQQIRQETTGGVPAYIDAEVT